MAISVRDIQEKEFSTQAKGGYNVEEVDDFLDEIADQMATLLRENLELSKNVSVLEGEVQTARQAALEAEKKTPEYNEKGYFENLQKSMREAMIGAQRIADETTAEAEAKAAKVKADAQAEAEETVSKAQVQADRITGEAQEKLNALNEQYENLRNAAKAFKADFSSLIEAQASLLKDKTKLI